MFRVINPQWRYCQRNLMLASVYWSTELPYSAIDREYREYQLNPLGAV